MDPVDRDRSDELVIGVSAFLEKTGRLPQSVELMEFLGWDAHTTDRALQAARARGRLKRVWTPVTEDHLSLDERAAFQRDGEDILSG